MSTKNSPTKHGQEPFLKISGNKNKITVALNTIHGDVDSTNKIEGLTISLFYKCGPLL